MTDRQIEKMFVDVVRGWYAEWHEENNKQMLHCRSIYAILYIDTKTPK